jgi:hypothetical protein
MKLPLLLSLTLFLLSSSLAQEPYWQQHVQYSIRARMYPNTNTILGSERLVYTNNSPDTLREVYFRLYWNLFREGSHGYRMARRAKNYRFNTTGGITPTKFALATEDEEKPLPYKVDDTILHALLPHPLGPGGQLTFSIEWEEKIPEGGDRTGHRGRDYNIAQWYPQIAVYDKYGWHTDQYTGFGEFHNDYGSFDVEITLPRSFILGYTGTLLNPDDTLPDSVRRKLSESEGKAETVRIADYSQRTIAEEDTSTLATWKFRADSVRDFAWSANEHYIWDVSHWEGVTIHSLYFTDKAEYWSKVAEYGRHAIQFFSENFGRYVYPNAFVVEGVVGGGMEYPGIVFIGHIGNKNTHSLFGVVAHELGHEWYPMMIGTNETEYAFQDEGFTTFLTILAEESYYGRYDNEYTWTEWWQRALRFPNSDSRTNAQKDYLILAKTGYEEPVATHSDRFREPGLATTSVYPKTATVMFMLQYVLGDSVFSTLMKEYYNRWRFKHPYPEDFFALAQEVSGNRDLRWFFDQWFHRTYQCDYWLKKISTDEETKEGKRIYRTAISIRRLGEAIMPLDINLEMKDGTDTTLHVPVDTWRNGVVDHKIVVDLPAKAKRAEINPDKRIADVNRLNNTYPFPQVTMGFENTIIGVVDPFAYAILWRPSVWYNSVDGAKLGLRVSGRYLDDLYQFNAWSWIGTKDGKLDFDISGQTSLPWVSSLSSSGWRGFRIEGRQGFNLYVTKEFRRHYSYPPYQTFRLGFYHLKLKDGSYLVRSGSWEPGLLNRVQFAYSYFNRGPFWESNVRFEFESSVSVRARSQFNYSKRSFDVRFSFSLPDGWQLATRFYNGRASGTIAVQTQYYLAGGSPIEEFSAPFLRSRGTLPTDLRNHALHPGGGNLRGYFAQLLYGDKIDAVNVELRSSRLLPFVATAGTPLLDRLLNTVKLVGFADFGRIAFQSEDFSKKRILMDLGFGLRVHMPRFTNLFQSVGLTTLRVDFPLYVNNATPGESRGKFRWVMGLSEAF